MGDPFPGHSRGSPPRARGARSAHRTIGDPRRITPACAGSTGPSRSACRPRTDHPRVRGEHTAARCHEWAEAGSPPRARGARVRRHRLDRTPGITPACAGSTTSHCRTLVGQADHPRVRGEHTCDLPEDRWPPGSPPRARGARWVRRRHRGVGGITPACAGSTFEPATHGLGIGDHPRVRGEHFDVIAASRPRVGSPPRARGAQVRLRVRRRNLRITPACAGSTRCEASTTSP